MKRKLQKFYYDEEFETTDMRLHPEKYRVGKGEQGVLLVQPYKGEILPHWRFKTPEIALKSAKHIYELFLDYVKNQDVVGADMARKFIQMGYTRSRRYYWHKSGRKFLENPGRVRSDYERTENGKIIRPASMTAGPEEKKERVKQLLPNSIDEEKGKSAEIFKKYLEKMLGNSDYQSLLDAHIQKYP